MLSHVPALGKPVRNPIPRAAVAAVAWTAAILVVTVLVWQGIVAKGSPNPEADGISKPAVILNTGILVFREGLEAILVLVALTASLVRTDEGHWKPVAVGSILSVLASIATWFIVVGLITDLGQSVPALAVQAATGLLAVGVLLVIMNWFFHKIYWTGWITHHNRRKKSLTESSNRSEAAVYRGLVLLGFTAVYREGFEIVIFLQSLRLRAGSQVVFVGVMIGLALTLMVAFLTFVAHRRLPYKKMLVFTGLLLGCVLLVMVGESVQEVQLAGWMRVTEIPFQIPDWMGTWFALFNNVQGIAAQILAGGFVIGSYFLARRVCVRQGSAVAGSMQAACIVPDCSHCEVSHDQTPEPVQVHITRSH